MDWEESFTILIQLFRSKQMKKVVLTHVKKTEA